MLRRVRREAVRRGSSGTLVMLTVPLPGELYDLDAHRAARDVVKEAVSGWPAWYTLERGTSSGLHAHVLTVTEAVPGVLDAPEVHGVPVWSLRGVLAYLSKPRDARAAAAGHRRAVPLWSLLEASEAYLSARAAAAGEGRTRLPAGSGTVNVPPRRRAAVIVPPLLLLSCLNALLSRRAATLSATHSRRAAVPAVRHRTARRWHLPGVPVSVPPSRRPALIGHARPPPRRKPRVRSWFPVPRGLCTSRQVSACRAGEVEPKPTTNIRPEKATREDQISATPVPYVIDSPASVRAPFR